jgi:O-antigen/teichoic acid export membrane protein
MQGNKQFRDFIIYLAGSLALAVISVIRLPVYTSYFTPAEFGYYSLVTITFTYLSIALYNWITSCLYRYYHAYHEKNDLPSLYSNLSLMFVLSSMILLLISLVWYFIAASSHISLLVLLAFLYLFTNQVISFFLVIDKLEGRALPYNIYQVVQALCSFLLVVLLILHTHIRIEAIFIGQILVNTTLLLLLSYKNRLIIKELSLQYLSFKEIRNMLKYGFVGFVNSIGILILISSDRYVIALFEDISSVGIYNQVYQIGQVSVYFLVTVFFNAITPRLNRMLTGFKPESKEHLYDYIYAYILLALPIAFYISIFPKQVAAFLLGEEFRQGYPLIPWIVYSVFIYGLTLFNETKLKFDHQYKPVVIGIICACLINVGLNFMFIPIFGYLVAAITTLIAYTFLFFYYYFADNLRYFQASKLMRNIAVAVSVLVMQFLLDLLIREALHIDLNKWLTFAEGMAFAAVYAAVLIYKKLINKDLLNTSTIS